MRIGMIGLGRMGANMVQRLMKDGHECVVFDISANAGAKLAAPSAVGADSLEGLVSQLFKPGSVWLMVPAGVGAEEWAVRKQFGGHHEKEG